MEKLYIKTTLKEIRSPISAGIRAKAGEGRCPKDRGLKRLLRLFIKYKVHIHLNHLGNILNYNIGYFNVVVFQSYLKLGISALGVTIFHSYLSIYQPVLFYAVYVQ